MNVTKKPGFVDRLPNEVEIRSAERLRSIVASETKDEQPMLLSLAIDGGEVHEVTLAPALTESLLELLRLVSNGCGFGIIPVQAELTTQQAADLLNVSRPFLVKLLEDGEIPFTKTGRHRRVRADDLFAYKDKRDIERSNALTELAQIDAKHCLA